MSLSRLSEPVAAEPTQVQGLRCRVIGSHLVGTTRDGLYPAAASNLTPLSSTPKCKSELRLVLSP